MWILKVSWGTELKSTISTLEEALAAVGLDEALAAVLAAVGLDETPAAVLAAVGLGVDEAAVGLDEALAAVGLGVDEAAAGMGVDDAAIANCFKTYKTNTFTMAMGVDDCWQNEV